MHIFVQKNEVGVWLAEGFDAERVAGSEEQLLIVKALEVGIGASDD